MEKFSPKFTNKDLAYLLRCVSAVYLITGENRFKVIAYEKAADTIDHLDRELYDIWENGDLFSVSGIGPSILSHIDEYFKKGFKDSHFEKIIKKVPFSVFELMKIPRIGPKKAYKLVKELNLTNPDTAINDLYKAIQEGKVAKIEGFGEKSAYEIKKMIEIYQKEEKNFLKERMPLPYAYALSQEIVSYLKKFPLIEQVDILGSLRRMTSTIGDIDIAVQPKLSLNSKREVYQKIISYFIQYPKKISVLNAGETKASILVRGNRQIDLRIQEKQNYGSMLQYFTGSKIHNIKLREYALKRGFSLSEYGIKPLKKIKDFNQYKEYSYNSQLNIFEFDDEEKFYRFLGLQYIPPELREGNEEIEKAEKNALPILVELADIKGDFHLHSSYDLEPSHDLGANSYREIINKAKTLGYQYIAFADHNPSISHHSKKEILNILKRRKEEIVKKFLLKKSERLNFFISLEVDILPNGDISIPIAALEYLDFIIVSIHSRFNMKKEEMTKRILKSLTFPKVKILGHPTGRLFGKREEINADWEKIFKECKKRKIAVEINAWPRRLDLPDHLVKKAVLMGVKLVINTDAHEISEMDNMIYGVAVARRGWATKNDIINTWEYKKVKNWFLSF